MVNWFDAGGAAYARARPGYPAELARWLVEAADAGDGGAAGHGRGPLVVDVGCGNGQFTALLAERSGRVVGIDPSRSQLASGSAAGRLACGAAERLPVAGAVAGLVTAAQAAHWFDLPAFCAEVRRIAAPGALLALITYATPAIGAIADEEPGRGRSGDGADTGPGEDAARLADRFDRFYRGRDGVGPYWPPERGHIDDGYAHMAVPFEELPSDPRAPASAIERRWTYEELLAYVSTWSAARAARAAGRGDVIDAFAEDLRGLWGGADVRRLVHWEVTTRLFRIRRR